MAAGGQWFSSLTIPRLRLNVKVSYSYSLTHARTLPWEFLNVCLCCSKRAQGARRDKSSKLRADEPEQAPSPQMHMLCTYTHMPTQTCTCKCTPPADCVTNKPVLKQQKLWNLILKRLPSFAYNSQLSVIAFNAPCKYPCTAYRPCIKCKSSIWQGFGKAAELLCNGQISLEVFFFLLGCFIMNSWLLFNFEGLRGRFKINRNEKMAWDKLPPTNTWGLLGDNACS